MKNILSIILILLGLTFIIKVNAIDCNPAYTGNWTVTENCTWPDGYKVNGDIYVGAYTITMGAGDDMGIDLSTKKITFTTGKILIDATAKIANHVSTRYYISVPYVVAGMTSCPSGMKSFNTSSGVVPLSAGTTTYLNDTSNPNPGPYPGNNANVRSMPSTGTFYCGTKGT